MRGAQCAVRLARGLPDDVEFSSENERRSDLDFFCRVLEAVVDEGANTISVSDTVGYAVSDETAPKRALCRNMMGMIVDSERGILSLDALA